MVQPSSMSSASLAPRKMRSGMSSTVIDEPVVDVAAMQREMKKLLAERDLAIQQGREWQMKMALLKAELDKERGSVDRAVAVKAADRERELRLEAQSEWAKSEAAWRERIRNERLLRLSYERVLMNLGFSPNRIASDLVRVSRPQPLPMDPGSDKTANLFEIHEAMVSQPGARRRGLFAYSIDDIKAGLGVGGSLLSNPAPKSSSLEDQPELFRSPGKRELLKSLANTALN